MNEITDSQKIFSSPAAIDGYSEGEEPIVFHYNRERRLQTAPKIVRDYYEGKSPQAARGLFKSLVQTRSSRTMLIVTMAMLLFSVFYGVFGAKSNEKNISGIKTELEAFSFADSLYASLRLSPGSDEVYEGEVSVLFRFFTENNNLMAEESESAFFNGEEIFIRTITTDYDIVQIEAEVTAGDESTTLLFRLQKRG